MKEFNEFVNQNKPLERLMLGLSEYEGIMLEEMFYDFAKFYSKKDTNSTDHEHSWTIIDTTDKLHIDYYCKCGAKSPLGNLC